MTFFGGGREEQGGEGAVGLKHLTRSFSSASSLFEGVVFFSGEMLLVTVSDYQSWWALFGLGLLSQLWLLSLGVLIASVMQMCRGLDRKVSPHAVTGCWYIANLLPAVG